MIMKKRVWPLDLQLFAVEDGGSEEENEDLEDDSDDDEDDSEEEDNSDEKKFSQKDIDETVKKRIARERRKWRREQQRNTSDKDTDGAGKAGDEDKETRQLREKASKAEELELKWTCLEHDVNKSCVDDVLALARVHMAKDEDMDIEDAIEEVLKKYPQFKVSSTRSDEENNRKSWGQRQTSTGARKLSGVESRFYELNPDLKK